MHDERIDDRIFKATMQEKWRGFGRVGIGNGKNGKKL
jgi:hypothetical protein